MAKCRKICFPNEAEAREYVDWKRRGPRGRSFRRVRFYACKTCGYIHFTRMTVAEFEQHAKGATR